MFKNWVQIFKTGNHTDGNGNNKTWTDQDIAQFADNFNPAPIVIGHPTNNTDSYGNVSELKSEGGILFAKFANLDKTFVKFIESGEISNRSIRAKNTDKGWSIDHVGFLGKSDPAVADLAPIFAKATYNNEHHDYTFAFHNNDIQPWKYRYGMNSIARMFQDIRDFIIDDKGLDKANEIIPHHLIDDVKDAKDAFNQNQKDFKKEEKDSMFKQEDIDKAVAIATKEATTKAQADFAKQQAELTHKSALIDAKDKVQDFIKAGNITPAQAQGMPQFIANLDIQNEYQFNKGGKDDKDEQVKPSAFFAKFVGNLKAGIKPDTNIGADDNAGGDKIHTTQEIQDFAKAKNTNPVDALTRLQQGEK